MPLDSHESDLYAKATPEAVRIVHASGWTFSYFPSALAGDEAELWIEIPFAFYPWWDAHERKAGQ